MTAPAASGLLYGANVRANGIRQHYLRFGGTGPALVIVPGITTAAALWAFVAERLCATFDVYILDVRGRGLSESGAHLDYSLDACAADVVAFAAALALEKYTLLGHSMGARIGIRAARQQPEAMKQLVLVDLLAERIIGRPLGGRIMHSGGLTRFRETARSGKLV